MAGAWLQTAELQGTKAELERKILGLYEVVFRKEISTWFRWKLRNEWLLYDQRKLQNEFLVHG